MRFLTAVSMEQPEMLEKVSRELWMRVWSRDEDITESLSILAAAEKAGMSTAQAQHFLEKIPTELVKNKLRETTEAACKYGVSYSMCILSPCLKREKSCCHGCECSWLLAAFSPSGGLPSSSKPLIHSVIRSLIKEGKDGGF